MGQKTEYRVVQNPNHLHDIYLQFKDKKTIGAFFKEEVECWRYVPESEMCEVSGKYLKRSECIEDGKFTSYDAIEHIGKYFGFELLFTKFTRKWENIDDYFVYINKIRAEHLKTDDTNWYENYTKSQKQIADKNSSEFKTTYL